MIHLLKRLLLLISLVILPLLAICVFRYHLYFANVPQETRCADDKRHQPITDRDGLVRRFSQALQFKTITKSIGEVDPVELVKFTNWIKRTYPTIHSSNLVKLEHVANYSLLYTIQGSDRSLKPYLLCSHLDVVPVEREKWTVEPFAGQVADGYLYGRGAIDVKDALIGILESLEHLLKNEKFQPRRTILIAFGHDEEGSGVYGAVPISKILQSRYKELEFIFDEGSFIMEKSSFPGITRSHTAFISVAEKGYLTVELSVKDDSLSGHSSMPPKESTITKLARAVSKFHSTTFPSKFGNGPEVRLLETLASHADFPFNYIYSNLWLFGPFIDHFLSNHKMGNSLIRTTSAVTMIYGGMKDNVLPSEATALVNHRTHPLDSIESAIEFDRQVINDDSISISIYKNVTFESHPISPFDEDSFGFNAIRKSIEQIFDDTLVVPGIMVASTDTKHYLPLSRSVYRFTPIVMDSDEIKRFHGHDERIKIDNYVKLVNFYHHVIITADSPVLEKQQRVKDEL